MVIVGRAKPASPCTIYRQTGVGASDGPITTLNGGYGTFSYRHRPPSQRGMQSKCCQHRRLNRQWIRRCVARRLHHQSRHHHPRPSVLAPSSSANECQSTSKREETLGSLKELNLIKEKFKNKGQYVTVYKKLRPDKLVSKPVTFKWLYTDTTCIGKFIWCLQCPGLSMSH